MTDVPGAAILRYTDADEFADAPRGDWWPDDAQDFHDEISDAMAAADAVVVEARVDTHGCPDVEYSAAVLRMPSAPWGASLDEPADALVILGDAQLTVLSYRDRAAALSGFAAHVAARQAGGEPYDYVAVPGQRRTAFPPGWTVGEGNDASR